MFLLALAAAGCARDRNGLIAERKAVAFLVREVPAWSRDNQCFSCHNNGDAARALYIASHKGHRVPTEALADTTAWLSRPEGWKNNKGDPGFSDARLANLQFAAALLTALETGHLKETQGLATAAALVRGDQSTNGSCAVEPANPIGSPATHGTALATYTGWLTTRDATAANWLRNLKPNNVPSAAALALFTNSPTAIEFLHRAQTSIGGWGPYPDSPPEPFDTALALLALAKLPNQAAAVQRGRQYLISQQQSDGSWPATTRPSGGRSYAQTISTTAWASLALLETGP